MRTDTDARRLLAAAIGLFFTVGAITAAFTFVDLLFLSTYPSDWLPYLFLGKTVTLLVFALGTWRLVVRGSRRVNAGMLFAAAASVLVARGLMELSIDGFPFAVVLWLDAVAVVVGVVAFNAVYDAFDLRHMKRVGPRLNLAAGLGGLVFGMSLPWLIGTLGAAQMLFVIALPLCIAGVAISGLSAVAVSDRESRQSAQPLRYPLFVRASIAFVLLVVVDTLADYTLKHEVALNYRGEEIGAFMGPFYGLTSAVTVLAQFGVVGPLLKRMGIGALLSALPAFAVLIAFGLFFAPGLWMAAAFRMGETVLRRAFDDFGRALVVNPLPARVKRSARLLWNGVAAPAGTCLAALLLLAASSTQPLRVVAIATLVCALAWLLTVALTMRDYRGALEQSVRVRRFGSAAEAMSEEAVEDINGVIGRCLAHSDTATVQFGYRLLEESGGAVPALVRAHLAWDAPEVRVVAIEAAGRSGDADLVDALFARIREESAPEVRWTLLETIVGADPQRALAELDQLLDASRAADRAAAVLVRLRAGNENESAAAQVALLAMAGSSDPMLRRIAARVLGTVEVAGAREQLRSLLADDEMRVRRAALRAVAARKEASLAPQVARLLGERHAGLVATSILLSFGEHSVVALAEVAAGDDAAAARAAIRVLTRIPGAATTRSLCELADVGDGPRRTLLARETAAHARRHGASDELRKVATRQVELAAQQVEALRAASMRSAQPHMAAEIDARRRLTQRRLLAWYAVATDPARVLEAMPVLLADEYAAGQDRAKALELLETLTRDHRLLGAVAVLDIRRPPSLGETPPIEDDWLDWIGTVKLTNYGGGTMELPDRVVLLRRCPLFRNLEGEALLAIGEVSEVRELVAGERLFRRGDPPDGLYVIAAGLVTMLNDDELLAVLKSTDVIGEVELLDGANRLADAVVRTGGSALFIDRETFESLTDDIPEVLRDLARRVVHHLRSSLAEHDDDPTQLVSSLARPAPPGKASADLSGTETARERFTDTVTDSNGQSAPSGIRKLHRGESVRIAGAEGQVVEITLAGHRFTLRLAEPPTLTAPGGECTELVAGENLLGRDARCDIVADAGMVDISRQHAVLHWNEAGAVTLTCLSAGGAGVPEASVG